jgi:hypothetical protein
MGAAQHGDLVPQHQQLRVLGRRRTSRTRKALVLIEKTWTWGPAAGRLAGAAALALAVATIWLPWLAPGLHAAPQMMN